MDNSAIIRGLTEHVADLRSKVEQLNTQIQAAEMTIRSLSVDLHGDALRPQPQLLGSDKPKTQSVVEQFLSERPDRWFRAGRIKRQLLTTGFPDSKSLTAAIISALNRAVKKGVAEKKLGTNGRSIYTWKSANTQEELK